MLHPHPREAAVVGLGSGNTLAALAGRKELQRVSSIEIIRPLLPTLRRSADRIAYPGLEAILEDPRIEHVFGDGRFFIKHSNRSFDIIEADALREGSAYSGTLYSVEYFELVRARLAPGGLAVTWAPTDRVERTFLKVFPHVVSFSRVFIGSNEPIHIDPRTIEARLDDPETARYYERLRLDIKALLLPIISEGTFPSRDGMDLSDVNTDMHPRDEFGIPAIFDLSIRRAEGSR
jgi:spermidine synthase